MAHQDYVKKTRAAKNKKSPYKKKKASVKEPMAIKAKLIGLLTLALLAGSAYFLWSIKDYQPENKQTTEQQPAKAITKPITKQTDKSTAIPPPPKEKWTYVDQLKTKEVEVGEYEVKKGGPYQMQCGSFRSKSQAEELKAIIAFTGIESQVRQAKGKSGTWYKVVLGPYERKRSAEKDKHKLKSNKVNHCQIWGWR
jgi:cell division protein FtsN